jgi:hypothetical protein
MRTKVPKDGGAPYAHSPWDEIVPLLFMGGHFYQTQAGLRADVVARAEFDLVISLYARDGHGPDPGVEHRYADIPDGPLTSAQIETICDLATLAADSIGKDRRVFVRCHSGYNRSGLVVGQALITMGYSADAAVRLIRERRSQWALNNALFVEYLRTGLDIACLLTGLEA